MTWQAKRGLQGMYKFYGLLASYRPQKFDCNNMDLEEIPCISEELNVEFSTINNSSQEPLEA